MRAEPERQNTSDQKRPAASNARQKKPVQESSGFSDHRVSSTSQTNLQYKIDTSSPIVGQRKQLSNAFGPTVQLKGNSESPALQREPGDNGLVEFIKTQADLADRGYDLLSRQVEVAKTQIDLLEFYFDPVTNEGNTELTQPKARIAETAQVVRDGVSLFPDEASDARATAVALGKVATTGASHSLLSQWSKDATEATAVVALTQSKVAAVLVNMKDEAFKMARIALAENEPHLKRGILNVADTCHAAVADGDREVAELRSRDRVSFSGKEKASLATTVSDALNNAATGVGFGTVGALDAGGAFNLSTAATNVLGVLGGGLGILFGAIGTFLGVKNAIRGAVKKKALKAVKSKLSDTELKETTDYAIEQKGKKVAHNAAAAVAGLLAIGASVIGLIALTVASFGVAAIVAGMVAGLVGLGFVGYRIINNWRKRKSERRAFADELIDQIVNQGDEADRARLIVSDVGLDPDQAGDKKFRDRLTAKMGSYAKSRRTKMAEGLVQKLIAGKPSEVFDSELILCALGIDPEWVRKQIEAEKVNAAISKVAGKLASW